MLKKYGGARQGTDYSIIWRMRIACWIAKTPAHTLERVTINDSPLQQWLYEHASVLHYSFIVCLDEA
jgi:hypothetical protein